MKSAAGTPTTPATCPQSALPSVMAPKKTVTKIASPRPRTQSGSATCAETLRLASTAIHETPASRLATSASDRLARQPEQKQRDRGAEASRGHEPIRSELALEPGQSESAGHRARHRWRPAGCHRAPGRRRSGCARPAEAKPNRRSRTERSPPRAATSRAGADCCGRDGSRCGWRCRSAPPAAAGCGSAANATTAMRR